MAQITVGAGAQFDLSDLDVAELRDLDVITATSTLRKIGLNAEDSLSLTGVGFTYDSGQNFTGGTITGFVAGSDAEPVFTFSNFSISATAFRAIVENGTSADLYTQIFSGNDDMTGGAREDVIHGYDGHDNIFGGDGGDTLFGEAGNDHIYGRAASGGADGADSLSGGDGADYVQGNAGNDTIDGGTGSDRLVGGGADDVVVGGTGNDSINGNLGNDTLDGGTDNDSIRGGQGNDSISGGDGNDQIYGDLGSDTLSGGAGVDYFFFSGNASLTLSADHITDFADGTDRIFIGHSVDTVLTGTAANAVDAATAAQGLLDGHAGNNEVAAVQVGTATYLFYASTNGATVDSAVILDGISTSAIGTADFL